MLRGISDSGTLFSIFRMSITSMHLPEKCPRIYGSYNNFNTRGSASMFSRSTASVHCTHAAQELPLNLEFRPDCVALELEKVCREHAPCASERSLSSWIRVLACNSILVFSALQNPWRLLASRNKFAVLLLGKMFPAGVRYMLRYNPKLQILNPLPLSSQIIPKVGHMASIDTAVSIITSCIIFSQPEPIRLADIASRAALRVQPHQAEVSATAAVHSAVASYTRKLMH